MATRLDRLFLLLESGSTPAIRRSAAEQLGDVQKLHPHEFNNLLSKVQVYLSSSNWDTRIAASQAVEAIAKHVPQWNPQGAPKKEENETPPSDSNRLSFQRFDLQRVLIQGASLLGSEGAEYDVADEALRMDQKEHLARQRQLLNKRLGLDVAGGMGITSEDLFKEDDLIIHTEASGLHTLSSVAELVQQQIGDGMSSREKNHAKRRVKQMARQLSQPATNGNGEASDSEPASKRRKTSILVDQPKGESKVVVDSVPDSTMNMEELCEWPFEGFAEVLMTNLFNPAWDVRHGAAIGLRVVVRLHGEGAGRSSLLPADQMSVENQQWLEDLALRLICVLALDRFGDFVADEVVAPVRESCAQTLGVTLHHMSPEAVQSVAMVILQLLQQLQWEVRHGGLLGIKYLLAVRQDLSNSLLPHLLGSVFMGLQDRADDVRTVAAAALLPVTDTLVTNMAAQVPAIVACLWHTLLDLDDLTASTNSVMTLLSTILSHPQVPAHSVSPEALVGLVPRLWPFLRHNNASVRKAALQSLHTLLTQENTKQDGSIVWLVPLLADALRHVYQRSLLEDNCGVLDMVYQVWSDLLDSVTGEHLALASLPWLGVWLCLAMQAPVLPFDPGLLIEAKHLPKDPTPSRVRYAELAGSPQTEEHRDYIGGYLSLSKPVADRDQAIIRSRHMASRLLGTLFARLSVPLATPVEGLEPPEASLVRLLCFHLGTKSGLQRLVTGLVVQEWAQAQQPCLCPDAIKQKLQECLTEAIYFDEIASSFTRMQTECRGFLTGLDRDGVHPPEGITEGSVLTLEQAQVLCTMDLVPINKKGMKKDDLASLVERQKSLLNTVSHTSMEQLVLNIRVQSCLAGALTRLKCLPEKLTPMIRPLMEALKKEENLQMQTMAAENLSELLLLCREREPCPNPKVIRNLCAALCCDASFTPVIKTKEENAQPGTSAGGAESVSKETTHCDTYSGILTLYAQQKAVDRPARRGPAARKAPVQIELSLENLLEEEDVAKRQILVQRRGAMLTLKSLAKVVGAELPVNMKSLWDTLTSVLNFKEGGLPDKGNVTGAQELVHSLQVLEVVGPAIHKDLHKKLLELVPVLLQCLEQPFTAIRHMAARCLGMLAKLETTATMNGVLEIVLPNMATTVAISERQGATEAVAHVIEQLGIGVLPYIVLLVVPLMGCMSDPDDAVRLTATQCFATLIRLMPLETGLPAPPEMSSSLVARKEEQREFLEQLMDPSKMQSYSIPIPVDAQLRTYQQDGVNWLAFMNKYNMHGILCDDMGLGKTLQSICILAGDHFNRAQKYKEKKSADCAPLPSLVVCPPTLTGHWVYEVEKFVSREYLNPLHYAGPPGERVLLQDYIKQHNLVVASYDVVRNDIDFFGKHKWNYIILDEGHIIKNSRTKLSKAVKQLICNHRLILSGTPIQNNVLELWSLFDFLLPGFLGSERQFQARYGRPILQSRDAKSSSREQEAGALAMEALHRQTLPFLLRRMKEDVLKDLPPKIIQDYYCDLSPLQVELYEDFSKSRAKQNVEDSIVTQEEEKKGGHGSSHVFQALQYLRKLVNHPALILKSDHPKYEEITARLKTQKSNIRDMQHAPKLNALKQLLLDCGLGVSESESESQPVVNQHRVLLFCQLKSMLDIVENDLLKLQLPSVTYLRLDGSVPAGSRHGLVNRFNNDPSIDLLLLTTHVGGLGLNLTGADTVIFVEHDWNPMKDLQAMDRAHRIGQKKVVNVYRLITRGTLEEKIMGLQKFKLNIANTVISQENSSLASMGTGQLLDLFSLDDSKKEGKSGSAEGESEGKKQTMKTVLEAVDELWDEQQYEAEYDLSQFMKSLKK